VLHNNRVLFPSSFAAFFHLHLDALYYDKVYTTSSDKLCKYCNCHISQNYHGSKRRTIQCTNAITSGLTQLLHQRLQDEHEQQVQLRGHGILHMATATHSDGSGIGRPCWRFIPCISSTNCKRDKIHFDKYLCVMVHHAELQSISRRTILEQCRFQKEVDP
jgi:hypothetical protein